MPMIGIARTTNAALTIESYCSYCGTQFRMPGQGEPPIASRQARLNTMRKVFFRVAFAASASVSGLANFLLLEISV
jgi:hypothetical protein